LQIQSINIEEIDKEVHQILTSMYKGDISVDNVITKLISYNNSPNQKENEKYAFILHCVFNELQFYYQYPEKELKKAAELFGKIINNNVIEGMLLTIVLKFILEGIKKGQGAMYTFGTIALNQLIGKISQ
jgi:CCR4-NOT transcription complex subunit 1